MKDTRWADKMLDPRLRAGWKSRLICFAYDLIYLFLIMLFISVLTLLWMLMTAKPPEHIELWELRQYFKDNFPHLLLIDQIMKGIAFMAYFFILPLLSSDHRTLGMVTFGVSLMNEEGEEITRTQFFKRELYKWLLFPGCFLALGPEKRALHDKLAKTYMVLN